jgi:capsular exopolysaccharide synthesis family protein
MSYIFEALQRAESERTGGSAPKDVDSVADLLQRVEREVERRRSFYEGSAGEMPKAADSAGDLLQDADPQIVQPPAARSVEEAPKAAAPPIAAPPAVTGEVEHKPSMSNLPVARKSEVSESEAFAAAQEVPAALPPDSRLVCLTDQGSLAAEKFRMLGLKLRHLRERRKLKKIVVTGTAPEEGKSLIAANLALNQSRSKVLKTLLVDGDLRRPTVASRFGCDSSLPGLSECLRGERQLSEVVYKLKGSGLWFLPAGRAPENPLELMQSGRLPELLERLGQFFDWIIVDTPPVVPVADTTFWMKLADGVLVVIREGVSEKRLVERAMESFDRATLLGVVVNSCSSSDHEDYYSRYTQPAVRSAEAIPSSAENENE